jgi:hypothetical protein
VRNKMNTNYLACQSLLQDNALNLEFKTLMQREKGDIVQLKVGYRYGHAN